MAPSKRNPNIALLERKRALTTLHALNAAQDKAASNDATKNARIDAQSAHEHKAILRRVRT